MTKNTKTTNNDKESKLAHLVGPTDPQIDFDARERLKTARIGLLLRHPFFGNLATRLTLINADEWCPTAATDGKNFYYNARFIMMLKKKEVEFLVGHEVLHVVYDHMDRRGDRDPQLWNIADDYCVNADLKKHGVGEFITTVPCLFDYKYADMSAEQVYDILYENAEIIDVDQLLEQLLDDHIDGDGGVGSEDGEDGDQEGKGPAKMTQEEKDQLKQEIKEAIISAAQGTEPGNLPKGVERMIKDMTAPVMDWHELIQSNVTSAFSNDYSFMKPNRRGWHMDAILPGMTPGEEIEADVFIDLSGSIGYDQGSTFLSEVGGMMSQFDGYKLRVHCFDTAVYNSQEFTSENMDDIEEYDMYGGGGTDFDVNWTYMKEHNIQPKKFIMFTDGMPWDSWGDESYCDSLFIIHGSESIVPPFGEHAYYSEG